jgi:thiol-disulfide isomerase/thioredoxin
MSRSTSSDRPSRRGWLKGAAAGWSRCRWAGCWPCRPLARPWRGRCRARPPWEPEPVWTLAQQRPLDADALNGKVVLVCFWTYSCINSLRVLPYLRAWQARYGARGLTVVGVHTPEFAFETLVPNVRQALKDLDVTFPVVLDSDRRIWLAFGNNAWPAFYCHRRRRPGAGPYRR